jgi:hypothetical protein
MSKRDVPNEELLIFVFATQWILCQIIRSILKAWKINTKGLNENPKEKKSFFRTNLFLFTLINKKIKMIIK